MFLAANDTPVDGELTVNVDLVTAEEVTDSKAEDTEEAASLRSSTARVPLMNSDE